MFDNLDRVVTPAGTAVYCWLSQPDTKFHTEGEYHVNVRVSQDEADGFIKNLKKMHKTWVTKVTKELGKKAKVKSLPIVEVVDDEGNATGEVDIKCKLKAQGKRKDGGTFEMKPRIFDAEGTPMNGSADPIGSGSTIKVSINPRAYYVPSIGAGLTFRIGAVQVIELVTYTAGGAGHEDFGFQSEDGFKVETFEEPATVTSDNNNDDDEDF
jgi:hypothetical protein